MLFHLLAGTRSLAQTTHAIQPLQKNEMTAWLDAWDVPDGQISLPRLMGERLIKIRTEHAAWAYDIAHCQTGNGTLSEQLKGGCELSMWWCSLLYERHPKVTPELYTIYRLRALEQLMEERGGNALETCGCSCTVNAALADMCTARGWRFNKTEETAVDRSGESRLRRIYTRIPALLRAAVRLVHWLWSVRRYLPGPAQLSKSDNATGTIVTYFPNIDLKKAAEGIFRSRYWETLHDALQENAGSGKPAPVRWLFIRFPSPQGSLQQCCTYRDAFRTRALSGISFNYLEEFLSSRDILACCRRFLHIAFASLRSAATIRSHFTMTGSALNLWPLLKDEYAESFRGWRCLERCLQFKGLENYVRLAGQQNFYTFPLENCPWERMLTFAVHKAGTGPVYGAQHSTIRSTDFRYFDDPRTFLDPETLAFQPDKLAGNGASACAQWQAAGVPAERLCRVEALRYLYLAGSNREQSPHKPSRLLVVTSFFQDETEAHLLLLAECIRQKILQDFSVTVKPHPYLPVEARLRELLGEEADCLHFSTAPIAEELMDNPLVWASNSTTVALEAAIKGLPVMVMQPSGDFDLCPLQDIPELPRTSNTDSVRAALKNAAPLRLDPEYLCLDTTLSRWRSMLGLR